MARILAVLVLLVPALQAAPPEVVTEKNIVYGKGADEELKLDFARPKGDGPFPLVVCIHGGAWMAGNRAAHLGTIKMLAENGYAAATVQYRLAPKYQFPAQVEDVKCAVRFLRANAKKYNLDPMKVAALGDSAGGHLSLLLGMMNPEDGLEGKGGSPEQSSKVQAVVNYYGPTEFATWAPTKAGDAMLRLGLQRDGDGILKGWLGTSDRKAEVMKKASPLTYVDSKDPPVLTFQGTLDPLVQPQQAKVLHEALKKAGVPEQLEILENAAHGWGGKLKEKTDKQTVEFLDKHLKGKKSGVSAPQSASS
jgi:acetyl esterase/lipase